MTSPTKTVQQFNGSKVQRKIDYKLVPRVPAVPNVPDVNESEFSDLHCIF
jgi:hypothetical protein